MTDSNQLRVGVIGARGRMGRAVIDCVLDSSDLILAALAVRQGDPSVGQPAPGLGSLVYDADLAAVASASDVLIDFSLPDAFAPLLAVAATHRTPLVSGTTGLSKQALDGLDELGRSVPCLYSPNMSVGIHVMASLLRQAVSALGADYDVEVCETHHRFKRDAPSGTAKRLLAELEVAGGRATAPTEIPVHAIRGGDVVGDHTVFFMGLGDRLEITHRATSRRTFAMGALRAARWLVGQPAGRYELGDVLAASDAPPNTTSEQ